MKKRHAGIWLVSGIILFIGATPIFISWICSGIIVADLRVHYFNGIGQIAGFFGKTETKSELTYKASMIHEDLVEVEVEFATLEEKIEVMDNLLHTKQGRRVGRYYSYGNDVDTKCTFKVKSSAEHDFREAIKEVKVARQARKDAEARQAEDASNRARNVE
jgi:hypothetical protein